VLVLVGSGTKAYATDGVRYVVERVPNARMHEIGGAGHPVALTYPEALAEAFKKFFSPAQQPA
jgi:pimeloyl-ACP methyl ester carboxylesterase